MIHVNQHVATFSQGQKARHRMVHVIARLVLGYVLAIVAFVPFLTKAAGGHSNYLAIEMDSDVPSVLQVYYDIGAGLREPYSVSVPLSQGRHEYALALPRGTYRMIRIDPGLGPGRYKIEDVSIRRPDGSIFQQIPMSAINPAFQLSLIERTPEGLVVESPPGSNDPQLLYVPAVPIPISGFKGDEVWLFRWLLTYWLVGVLIVVVLERALRPVAPTVARALMAAVHWSGAHPKRAVLGSAALATVVATYPILFLHRSQFSPNNGGLPMLYDTVPVLPGSQDTITEDVRGTDVAAMMLAFVPYTAMQRHALSFGEVPLWNRFNAAGRSLWGQGQTFLLDPLHWFALADRQRGLDLKSVAHRFVFAVGVGIAALALTGSCAGAVAAAGAAPFVGYFTLRFNHPAVWSLTYAPWILVGWLSLIKAQNRAQMARAAVLLAVASALVLLASPPKEALVMVAGCEAAGCLALLAGGLRTRETGSVSVWQQLGFAAAAGTAVMMVTAPDWLLFLDSLRGSGNSYEAPRAVFAPLWTLPAILLGSFSYVIIVPTLYAPALPLLATAVVMPGDLLRRRATVALLSVALCLLAVGFGLFPESWLIHVPLIANIYQIHYTTIATAVVLLSVVCAVGFESLLAASWPRILLLILVASVAAVWIVRTVASVATDPVEPWLVALLLISAAGLPLAVLAVRQSRGRVLPVVAAVSLGALTLVPGGFHIETGMPALDRLVGQPRLRVDLEMTSPAVDAVHHVTTEPWRTIGIGNVLFSGSQALFGLEGIGGPDALFVNEYEELVNAARIERPWPGGRFGGWWMQVNSPDVARLAPLLDLLNVGFVLAPLNQNPTGLIELPFQPSDRVKVFRRPTAWPRAFFTDAVDTYREPRELLEDVAKHRTPLAAVQLTDGTAIEATRDLRAASHQFVAAIRYKLTTNTTSFSVRASGPGVAVLTETFIPDDFRATLNGQPVPYFRVNHAFKGIAIPSAGEWNVTFEYRPHHWTLSLAIAAAGVLLIGTLSAFGWKDSISSRLAERSRRGPAVLQ